MLLAIDIGNTNTVIGLFVDENLIRSWRIATSVSRTADENAVLIRSLFELSNVDKRPTEAIIASVVPNAVPATQDAIEKYLNINALIVGPGFKSGMPILYENPKEVGADRIVNAVAAYKQYQSGLIVVDFGTATTFDCITPKGEYLGGVITPGITISADALYRHAAKLPRVEIRKPKSVIGRTTVDSMQAGLYFGYAGLVDGIVNKIQEELNFETTVIATGGLAPLITEASQTISIADEGLTLRGLEILNRRNRPNV